MSLDLFFMEKILGLDDQRTLLYVFLFFKKYALSKSTGVPYTLWRYRRYKLEILIIFFKKYLYSQRVHRVPSEST